MKTYQHTQRGKLILIVMGIMAAVFLILGATVLRPLLITAPILAIVAWLFHSLTIEIDGGELCWRFGTGLIRKRVPLDQIISVEPVRTNFLEGWGIHLSRFGWLYNVSGFDAVSIRMKSGKNFALGTDEPDALVARINQARTK